MEIVPHPSSPSSNTSSTQDSLLNKNQFVARKKVLVIDDCPDLVELFEMILESNSFEVFSATSGAAALSILTEITELDLILLDVTMVEMSGIEFLERFEKEYPDFFKTVPVVFLSGMENIPDTKASGFIRKPMANIETFLKSVCRYIDEGKTRNSSRH